MPSIAKLVLAALSAAVVLAVGAGTATANRSIAVEPNTGLSATSARVTFTGGSTVVVCEVTLNGSLHPLIAKSRGSLMGYITEGRTANCDDGTAFTTVRAIVLLTDREVPPNPLPWHVRFESFEGTLPDIRAILFIVHGTRFLIEINLFGSRNDCLYEGLVGAIARGGPNNVNEMTIQLPNSVALALVLAEDIAECPEEGTLNGNFRLARAIRLALH